MANLSTNTASLQDILEKVNALPNAGEDVTAETETYTELLTDLEAAVDALPDAGSGSSVETCSVRIYTTKSSTALLGYATQNIQGEPVYMYNRDATASAFDVTLTDIPTNGVITVFLDYTWFPFVQEHSESVKVIHEGNANYHGINVFGLAAAAGETATIRFTDDE